MSYEKTIWNDGDIITAEKLNNIEDGIEAANEKKIVVFDGSITTTNTGAGFIIGSFTPTSLIAGDSLLIKFENVVYELPKITLSLGTGYGEFDDNERPILTNYPCAITISYGYYNLFTSEANTYEVEIKAETENSDFIINVQWDDNEQGYIMDKDFTDVEAAFQNNRGLKVIIESLSLRFNYFTSGIGGNKYFFSGMFESTIAEGSSNVSISFITVIISNSKIDYITKTASLVLQ